MLFCIQVKARFSTLVEGPLLALLVIMLCTPVRAQVMLGAYVPGDGWDVSEIVGFNEASDKELAFVTFFSAFSHNWPEQLHWQASNIYNNGAIPLITWMPVDLSRKNADLLPEIIAGGWDAYIDNWIDGLQQWVDSYASYKKPIVLLRFAHEFNGSWYPYSGNPDLYIQAWQHVHDRFTRKRANDYVEWVWSANHINFDSHDDMTLYYPGTAYVDWTSLDGYNWGSNHDWTGWDSFRQLFAAAYHTLVTHFPDKPILIAEYGTAEPADQPSADWMQYGDDSDHDEDKAFWLYDTLTMIEQEFPAIRGLGLFNLNKELSWSLTSAGNTGLRGYNLGIRSDHYTSSFLGARLLVLGAAIDDETLRRLEEEPEPVYDVILDNTLVTTDTRRGAAPRAFYATDRLRTQVVRRDLIDMQAHRQSATSVLPDAVAIEQANATARQYRQRYRQQRDARGPNAAMGMRMRLPEY